MSSGLKITGVLCLLAATSIGRPWPAAAQTAVSRQDDRAYYVHGNPNAAVWPRHDREHEIVQEASVVLQIDGDTGSASTSAVALLTTSALVENAVHQAFQIDRSQVREAVQVLASNAGIKMTRLEVCLLKAPGIDWKQGDAKKMIEALADSLRAALNQSANAASRLMDEATKKQAEDLEKLNAKIAETRGQLAEVNSQLRSMPNQFQDPRSAVRNATSQLQSLDNQIRQNEDQLAQRDPGTKSLLEEWEELVKLREDKLRQLKDEKRPESEVKDAEIQLAEARTKFASFQSGNDRSYRSEAGEIVRLKSRIEALKRQRAEAEEVVRKLDSPETQALFDKQRQLTMAEETLQNDLMRTRSRMNHVVQPPPMRYVVTLLDGASE